MFLVVRNSADIVRTHRMILEGLHSTQAMGQVLSLTSRRKYFSDLGRDIYTNMEVDMDVDVEEDLDQLLMLAGMAALIDDDVQDAYMEEDEQELWVRYQRPRSCWVRPWLLRREEDRQPTLFGLIQELEAVSGVPLMCFFNIYGLMVTVHCSMSHLGL